MMRAIGRRVALALPLAAFGHAARGENAFASVGSGQPGGIYYPVARAMCQMVNADPVSTGVLCSPEATPGSAYNADALRSGELEFGIVQSDIAYAAYNGTDAWAGKPDKTLRSVFLLHPELVTIIAREAAHVRELADLSGKRINVGGPGTGTRATWQAMEAALGWSGEQVARKAALKGDAAGNALCAGDIDATLLIVGHPSGQVRTQLSACGSNLVAVNGPAITKLLGSAPYLHHGRIPAGLYGQRVDVLTFGGNAILMTSAETDLHVVAAMAKAVVGNVAELRIHHPALAQLTAQEMTAGNFPAPLHPGALQAFKELGLSV